MRRSFYFVEERTGDTRQLQKYTQTKKKPPIFMELYLSIQLRCCNKNKTKIRRFAEIQIFEKTYLIVIKDETCLKFKINDSTLFLIGSYAQKLVASY